MNKIRLIIGGILFIILAVLLIVISSSAAAAPGGAPLLDDPTPTPCIMAGDFSFELDPFDADSFSGSNTWEDIIIDASGSTGQFDVTITFDAESYRDLFGAPDPIGSDVLFKVYSGSNMAGDQPKTVAAGSSTDNEVTIHHETIRADDELRIDFTMQVPAVAAHSSITITSITFDGLVIEAPCQGCFENVPDDMDAVKAGTLVGTDEIGHVIELTEGETYLLYTDPGPWNDGADDRTDAAIRFYDGASWGEFTAIADYENAEADIEPLCDDSFLEEGYDAIVFTATEDMTQLQIRVNDEDEAFDDNSGYLNYYLSIDTGGILQTCGANWSKSDLIGSVTVDATDSDYQDFTSAAGKVAGAFMTDGLYALKVIGSYTDNGVTADDVRMADYPSGAQMDTWLDENFLSGADTCDVNANGYNEFYGSARSDFYDLDLTYGFGQASPLARVEDDDSNYANNAGNIVVELYGADYTAPASDCSTKYNRGTWLDSVVIFADSEVGREVPIQVNGLVPGQTYYIENAGYGYNQNGTLSYDFQIGVNVNEGTPVESINVTWYDPEVLADCTAPVDQDHTGYYFVAPKYHVWLRTVPDLFASYEDNTGSLGFNIYGAVPYEVPDGESCSDWVTADSLVFRDSVAADSTPGYSIDWAVFEAGEEYAIKIVSPPYTDPDGSGKTGEIRRSAPGSGSVEYESMEDWGAAICTEQVDGYDIVYFRASDLTDYEVRATEPSGGNSGTITFEVWGTAREQEPILGCELRDYGDTEFWYVVKEKGIVYANNDGSINSDPSVLANEFSSEGLDYKIEVGYINGVEDGVSENYFLEISDDGGNTWISLEDWVDCWVDLDDPYSRGYFTTPKPGGPYLLRVYDAGGDWVDNAGGLQVKLWVNEQDADPGDVGSFYDTVVEGWGTGCTAVCVPPGWLEVGQWIEYARCRLTRWLAWCPWHAEAIEKMQKEFYNIEPFGTLIELMGVGKALRDEIGQYTWTDEGGGGDNPQFQAVDNYIFFADEGGGGDIPLFGDDSIWGTGEIELHGPDGYSYDTECDNLLADSLGPRLAGPVCFAANVTDQLGVISWFQLFWDLTMVVLLLAYIKKNWTDALQ